MKKRNKHGDKLKPGEIRVINIDKTAAAEWFFESIQEHCPELFQLGNIKEYELQCAWDCDAEELTCIISFADDNQDTFSERGYDFAQIRAKVGLTTKSLFARPGYKTLNYLEDSSLLK